MSIQRKPRGLTLLELLIVGVMVTFVGVMTIAAASKINRAARSATCVSNLSQLTQAINTYAIDNTGYYPYVHYWAHSDPKTWHALGGSNELITWVSVLNPYLGDGSPPPWSSRFQCPEAQLVASHPLSYVMNMIVAIAPERELEKGAPPSAQFAPSKTIRMLEWGTALLWDTAIQPDWQNNLGVMISLDLDIQRHWSGANVPQFRYFSYSDPFSFGPYGNNRALRLGVAAPYTYYNIDPPSGSGFPFQGNLRFRHGSDNVVNVGFSDGSVRQFTAVLGAKNTVTSNNAIRRYFMTRWPPNTPPNWSYPDGDLTPPLRDPGASAIRNRLAAIVEVASYTRRNGPYFARAKFVQLIAPVGRLGFM